LWGNAIALECLPPAINGMPDHMRILLSIPPRLAVAATIGQWKGGGSLTFITYFFFLPPLC
jgi:REP element-mobilizing transposase RayT